MLMLDRELQLREDRTAHRAVGSEDVENVKQTPPDPPRAGLEK